MHTDRYTAKPKERRQGWRYRGQTEGNTEWKKKGESLGLILTLLRSKHEDSTNFLFCAMTLYTFPKVKERKKRSLNSPFPISVQFPGVTRHQRGPSMQLLMSEAYLPHRRNGSNQTDVRTLYQNSHFGPVLLWEKFCLNVTLFNPFSQEKFTFLVTCLQENAEPSSLQTEK